MGCCGSRDATDRNISEKIKTERDKDNDEKKLLLLGTGASGKSTIFKNLRRVQGETMLNPATVLETINTLRLNLVEYMIKLLMKAQFFYNSNTQKYADCELPDDELTINHVKIVLKHQKNTFSGEIEETSMEEMNRLGKSLVYLWGLSGIQATFKKKSQFSFPDNLEYFYEKAVTVMDPKYTLTEEDLLKVRVRTAGAVVYTYMELDTVFQIFDVGGQRSERKKWMSHFDNVSGVIFVTALNHYNAVLFEDEGKNAMHEAVQLFKDYANIPQFEQSELILFLNKKDLFKEQLKTMSLAVCFSEEAGWKEEQWKGTEYKPIPDNPEADLALFEKCCEESIEFIQNLFVDRNLVENRVLFSHVTCATDQNNVKTVFWDVQNIVIRSNLKRGGLIV